MDNIILRAGIRVMPLTEPLLQGEVPCEGLTIQALGVTPYTETFRLMARDLAYDIAEMPVVTHLLAVDAGKPLTALPVILAAGGIPHVSLVCASGSRIAGPGALKNGRIGIRAFAQTTGVWMRGILQHDYGVDSSEVSWVTTEDSHIDGFQDPDNVERAPTDDLFAILARGEVDAIITSPHTIKDPSSLRTVIPEARAAGQDWARRQGITAINHVLCLQTGLLARYPGIADKLTRCFTAARDVAEARRSEGRPYSVYGEAANRRSIGLLLDYAYEQGMTSRHYRFSDLFLPSPQQQASSAA